MKILFLLQYIPYPLNTGGNQAVFNMLDKIRKEYEVSILTCVMNKEQRDNLCKLQTMWTDVHFYNYMAYENETEDEVEDELPDTLSFKLINYIKKSFTRKVERRIRKKKGTNKEKDFIRENSCLFNRIPSFDPGFLKYVQKVTSEKKFDVIQVEFYEMLPIVFVLPKDAVKIYVQHEIRFVRNKNEMDFYNESRAGDAYRYEMTKSFEMGALGYYDYVVALTEKDKEIMQRENDRLKVYVSPAAVTMPEKEITWTTPASELVFVGGGEHFPNADGIMWFCKEVFPLLRANGINVKLNIVGVWGDRIRKVIEKYGENAEFVGFVDDLGKYMAGKISVVPIRMGSGMRMKLLESAFASSPTVTTSKGCEGLPFVDGENCYVADTALDFAQAIKRLLDDVKTQERFAKNAISSLGKWLDTKEMQEKRMQLYKTIEKEWK